jgi:hypothetical protein
MDGGFIPEGPFSGVHVMFVGKERLFHFLLSQSLMVGRFLSPRPRPQEPALSKVEGPSGEVCFLRSGMPHGKSRFLHFGPLIVAFARNDMRFPMQFLPTILTRTPVSGPWRASIDSGGLKMV